MYFEFIESSVFSAYLGDYLSDDEFAAMQAYLCEMPEAGNLLRGSGGVRKLRWARAGVGKSSGVRVCYYARSRRGQILLLVIYAKSARDSISTTVLRSIREELENGID